MTELEDYAGRLEALAQRLGLQHYAVDFELAPASLMTEIAVYGLPIRMPHWSYGVRYIHQLVRQSMGHSKIFEVMFPGDPCRAFLMDSNSLAENTLVAAHVLGHADFSRNNQLFARFHAMAGGNMVEHAAAQAQRIQQAIEAAGLVRVESLYFYPMFACQRMNEGWASYWHPRLLREADFLPQPLYLSAIKVHSDVVRPFASGEQTALAVNPYHLGFTLWEHIVEKHGLERAREVMRDEDDFGFIRNCLDRDLAEKAGLFVYEARPGGELRVASRDLEAIREAILAPKYNYGAPRVAATELKSDGTLVLTHEHASDGRGLDAARAKKVLEYTRRAWRRAVRLHTVNERGEPLELAA